MEQQKETQIAETKNSFPLKKHHREKLEKRVGVLLFFYSLEGVSLEFVVPRNVKCVVIRTSPGL
jgi:hypothetical protein